MSKEEGGMGVVLRIRPFTERDRMAGRAVSCMEPVDGQTVEVAPETGAKKRFQFMRVFNEQTDQETFFRAAVLPYLSQFFGFVPAEIFSYGITNSGKTFTISGTPRMPGVIPRVADVLFRVLHTVCPEMYAQVKPSPAAFVNTSNVTPVMKPPVAGNVGKDDSDQELVYSDDEAFEMSTMEAKFSQSQVAARQTEDPFVAEMAKKLNPERSYAVRMCYFEILNEVVSDLLNDKKQCECRSNGEISGIRWFDVYSMESVMSLIARGQAKRTQASNGINAESSRSHAIITFKLFELPKGERLTDSLIAHGNVRATKLMIADLAGSERADKTGAEANGTGFKQGTKINQSLLFFKRCIEELRERQKGGKNQISIRNTMLTRVCADIFNGLAKALLIVNVNQSITDCGDTIRALEFGVLTKTVKDDVRIKHAPNSAEMAALHAEVERLNEELATLFYVSAQHEMEARQEVIAEVAKVRKEASKRQRKFTAACEELAAKMRRKELENFAIYGDIRADNLKNMRDSSMDIEDMQEIATLRREKEALEDEMKESIEKARIIMRGEFEDQISSLNKKVDSYRKDLADRDEQITKLREELEAMRAQPQLQTPATKKSVQKESSLKKLHIFRSFSKEKLRASDAQHQEVSVTAPKLPEMPALLLPTEAIPEEDETNPPAKKKHGKGKVHDLTASGKGNYSPMILRSKKNVDRNDLTASGKRKK